MAYIGTHPNIVELIGAEVSGIYRGQVFAVLEFCPNGSLDEYLKKQRAVQLQVCPIPNMEYQTATISGYENIVSATSLERSGGEGAGGVHNQSYKADPTEIFETSFTTANNTVTQNELQQPDSQPTVTLLCHWSHQVSSAMSYLTSKSIVHGDLATRNVLVFNNNILKLTDFGQSHKLYSSIYVDRDQHRQIPWKWMSPEALEYRQFSSKSDVWSYGVTLWEVFMFAAQPYANQSWHPNFPKELRDGTVRLAKPDLMPQEIYDAVFILCFEADPEARIDFVSINNFWTQG